MQPRLFRARFVSGYRLIRTRSQVLDPRSLSDVTLLNCKLPHTARALIMRRVPAQGRVRALRAGVAIAEIAIRTDRHGSRRQVVGINEAGGVGHVAAQTDDEALRGFADRAARAGDAAGNGQVTLTVRHFDALDERFVGAGKGFVDGPARAQTAKAREHELVRDRTAWTDCRQYPGGRRRAARRALRGD